jgi:eukaryotic-like serine/threonine-protein kinase
MPVDSPDADDPPPRPGLGIAETATWSSPLPEEAAPVDSRVPAGAFPFLAVPQSPDEIGQLGPYRVLHLLGAGGMGLVFCAEDRQLQRRVALKVMKPHLAAEAAARQRFLREARSAAAIDHDHVISIYQVGEDRGMPFLAMPLLQGETLHARLRREGRFPPAEIVRIGREIADGLTAAHERGLIHRDIKPANLWLEAAKQRVKILDFGLARAVADPSQLTMSGAVVGTPYYMAPEQARGGRVDPRSDLFSLGCVLYQMCTAALPFPGSDVLSVLSALALHHPPPPAESRPEIPQDLSQLIMELLAKDPRERPDSARTVLEAFHRIGRDLAAGTSGPAASRVEAVSRTSDTRRAIDSIAVLPLLNDGSHPDAEYLSDGISEGVIDILSQLPTLRVLARSTVFRYKGQQSDALEIGRRLGVSAVVTGRLLQRANRLIIKAELVDTADGAHLWGCHFDRELAEILTIEQTLSREIADNLRLRLTGADQQRLGRRQTENAAAYRLYLQGRYHWNKRAADSLKKSIRLFEQAIDLDPSYALAYTGVADVYLNLGGWGHLPCREAYPRAKAAAIKALAIDDTLAEAHVSLAMVQKEYDWDWPGAEQSFLRALERNPNYAIGWQWYGEYLAALGRHQEAISAMQRSVDLDPLSLIIHATLGRHGYYLARQYDRAIAQLTRTLEMDDGFWVAHLWLGLLYAHVGQFEEAIAECEAARRLDDNLEIVAVLGYTYGRAGRRQEAQQMLAALRQLSPRRYVSPMLGALIATGLGDLDEAFGWLEQAWQDRAQMMSELQAEPAFDPLREDPRFADLLRRVGLGAAHGSG